MRFLVLFSIVLLGNSALAIRCRLICRVSENHGEVEQENPLKIYSRADWGAVMPSNEIPDLQTPVKNVVIAHTVTPSCTELSDCFARVRNIQEYHMLERRFDDIGYNFLVGSEGSIFTGRGFGKVGSHTKGYNSRTLGIALIGSFQNATPGEVQLNATMRFLDYAVEQGKLASEFKLFGHRQLIDTLSPGAQLYNILKTWPHFADNDTIVEAK